nr:unnamed protein product [Callosobruchus chinensis]
MKVQLRLQKLFLKKGKTDSQLKMKLLKLGRYLKQKKKKSLTHLFAQEFGEEWEQKDDLQ